MGLAPDRGAVEAKSLSEVVPKIAQSQQVSKYLGLYKLVLVTNFREFLLVEKRDGQVIELERFEVASSEAVFWQHAEDHGATTKRLGDRFLDFIERVMLQEAQSDSPQQVASFLASYARDALARLESADVGLGG